jgi:hypothetical protein
MRGRRCVRGRCVREKLGRLRGNGAARRKHLDCEHERAIHVVSITFQR